MTYLQIEKENEILYGGNQNYFAEPRLKGYGCGLIAAADVSLILRNKKKPFQKISWVQYESYIREVRKFFFLIPRLGLNGWQVALGINLIFLKYRMPYIARWKMSPINAKTKSQMEEMLNHGIPVIIAAGPNFPNIFGKERVPLYRPLRNGVMKKVNSFHKHFVVITSIEGEDVTVSSWGKEYHMKWFDFLSYAREKSVFFFTNYLLIKQISYFHFK